MHSLRQHWEDEARARKFLSGGTRIGVLRDVLEVIEPHIDHELWIDIAPGAGFVQSMVSDNQPSLFVGIDISRRMLVVQTNKYGERIQGSCDGLPIRRDAAAVSSIFFSLSDYPDISDGISELIRISRAIISFTDYGDHDEYWLKRKSLHGETIAGETIIGDINLRSADDITPHFKETLIMSAQCMEYIVNTHDLVTRIPLNNKIKRCFVHVLAHKNRCTDHTD